MKIKKFIGKSENKKYAEMKNFKKLMKKNDYELKQTEVTTKNNNMYINYSIDTKIEDSMETIGMLVGKIPLDEWDKFKEKYEENHNLKVFD